MLPKEQKSGCDHVVRTARRLPQANAPATNARFCPRLRMRGGIREHTEKRTDGLFSEKNGAFQAQFYPDRLVLIPTKRSAEQWERFCRNPQKRSSQIRRLSRNGFAEICEPVPGILRDYPLIRTLRRFRRFGSIFFRFSAISGVLLRISAQISSFLRCSRISRLTAAISS